MGEEGKFRLKEAETENRMRSPKGTNRRDANARGKRKSNWCKMNGEKWGNGNQLYL
jgi:hypothetical protein